LEILVVLQELKLVDLTNNKVKIKKMKKAIKLKIKIQKKKKKNNK